MPRTLVTPLDCRRIAIPGMVVFAPINTGFAADGVPDKRLLQFHKLRAGRGIGIAFVGNVATDLAVRTNPGTAVLADDTAVSHFEPIARAIADRGTLPGIQLGDTPNWLAPIKQWRPPDLQMEVDRLRTQILKEPTAQLHALCDRFVRSARLAVQAGFSVIEVHAAHGYSLSLLLNDIINTRTDEFAIDGSWLEALCGELRAIVGSRVLLTFRISGIIGLRDRQSDILRTIALGKRLVDLGVDMLDISAGFYSINRQLIYPKQDHGPANLDVGSALAATVPGPVIVSGAIRDIQTTEVPDNVLIGLGRPLLADPRLVDKILDGLTDLVVPCCSSGRCHYATTGQSAISCGQNPQLAENGG